MNGYTFEERQPATLRSLAEEARESVRCILRYVRTERCPAACIRQYLQLAEDFEMLAQRYDSRAEDQEAALAKARAG